jgi:hypothetical protein
LHERGIYDLKSSRCDELLKVNGTDLESNPVTYFMQNKMRILFIQVRTSLGRSSRMNSINTFIARGNTMN